MSSVLFIASSSSLQDEAHIVHSRGHIMWKSVSKYIQPIRLMVNWMCVPSQGLLFQSTFTAFVCWLDSCPVLFMPCCCCWILFLFGFTCSQRCCWTVDARLLLFMDCKNRLREVEWLSAEQCVLSHESTGNLEPNFFIWSNTTLAAMMGFLQTLTLPPSLSLL